MDVNDGVRFLPHFYVHKTIDMIKVKVNLVAR